MEVRVQFYLNGDESGTLYDKTFSITEYYKWLGHMRFSVDILSEVIQ